MMWTMRQRTDMDALPDHRVVIRFEFSGVPANRTRLRIMWLVLDRSGVDVCAKGPGLSGRHHASRRRRGFRQNLSGTNDLGRGDGESGRYRGKCALGATDSRVDSFIQGAETAATHGPPRRLSQSCFGIRCELLPCLVLCRFSAAGETTFPLAPSAGGRKAVIRVEWTGPTTLRHVRCTANSSRIARRHVVPALY
jgi:hypothetical protein